MLPVSHFDPQFLYSLSCKARFQLGHSYVHSKLQGLFSSMHHNLQNSLANWDTRAMCGMTYLIPSNKLPNFHLGPPEDHSPILRVQTSCDSNPRPQYGIWDCYWWLRRNRSLAIISPIPNCVLFSQVWCFGEIIWTISTQCHLQWDCAQMGGQICHKTKVLNYLKSWSKFENYN